MAKDGEHGAWSEVRRAILLLFPPSKGVRGMFKSEERRAESMVHGAWGMEHGAWSMGHGAWGMEHGAWSEGRRAWGMEHGAWGMEQRAKSVEY